MSARAPNVERSRMLSFDRKDWKRPVGRPSLSKGTKQAGQLGEARSSKHKTTKKSDISLEADIDALPSPCGHASLVP